MHEWRTWVDEHVLRINGCPLSSEILRNVPSGITVALVTLFTSHTSLNRSVQRRTVSTRTLLTSQCLIMLFFFFNLPNSSNSYVHREFTRISFYQVYIPLSISLGIAADSTPEVIYSTPSFAKGDARDLLESIFENAIARGCNRKRRKFDDVGRILAHPNSTCLIIIAYKMHFTSPV